MHSARNALTDNIVERLLTFFQQMINTVSNEAMGGPGREYAQRARRGGGGDGAYKQGGLFATLSLLSKPEAQHSLAFILIFRQKLQQRVASA